MQCLLDKSHVICTA